MFETGTGAYGAVKQPLDVFFAPKSVAVMGAAEDQSHPGRAVIWNLISSPFGGTIYPVHPDGVSVLGIRSYRKLAEVPERLDLALIATPCDQVEEALRQCLQARVKGVIVLSSRGAVTLSPASLAQAANQGTRILGPNSLGVMRPVSGLNATFAPVMARPGSVALVSQSGAICTALLDWGRSQGVGFSTVISLGAMADVAWAEVIDRLGSDPKTRSIVLYLESIGDARAFLSAAREVALDKPIILIKGGSAPDGVFDAAMRRVGVVRVEDLNDVFTVTDVLARQPAPAGPRLAIITNAAGPGSLARNALSALGGQLATSLDLGAFASAQDYRAALESLAKDPGVDGILVIQAPHSLSDRVETARALAAVSLPKSKPVLAAWMGSVRESASEAMLVQAGIPAFPFPEAAVRAFCYMWHYTDNLRAIYETPALAGDDPTVSDAAARLLETVRSDGRTALSNVECRQLLALYGLAPTIKSPQLNSLPFALACHVDRDFGPVLSFGLNGGVAGISKQVSGLPVLNTTLARRFLESSGAYDFLRDRALEPLLVRFSRLVLEQPSLAALRIDLGLQATALVLKGAATLRGVGEAVPRPAIRPYPSQYVSSRNLADGTPIHIAPIRPEDEPAMVRFHRTLSTESVYRRYFMPLTLESRIRHERLTRVCFLDYDRQMAFVARLEGEDTIVAVGRIVKAAGSNEAELAALVSDRYQQRGIGSQVVQRLIEFARDEKLLRLTAYVLSENIAMRRLLEKAGFHFSPFDGPEMLEGVLHLTAPFQPQVVQNDTLLKTRP